ncbi:hypothetical protein BCU69_20955 [Vibrio cyclitrophicus]|uniref:hypothetical protein n=1 Tax=Vibrio cyclitrophicus TaxID=47951 RepID=UPI000C819A29|nr:hypothetical protein [Vibrio cyclitrophicus]PMH37951.1 hypothetical protein BCU69_20955 [Vibrio cyclitrophicus]
MSEIFVVSMVYIFFIFEVLMFLFAAIFLSFLIVLIMLGIAIELLEVFQELFKEMKKKLKNYRSSNSRKQILGVYKLKIFINTVWLGDEESEFDFWYWVYGHT